MNRTFTAVTVSRQFGAGGHDLCYKLAARLGVPLFHRELLTRLATEMRTSEEMLDTYEKMKYGAQQFVLTSLSGRYSFLEKDILRSRKYIESLRKVMLRMVSLGGVVILGRGGQCILHGHPGILHLRLVAEDSFRISRLSGFEPYAGKTPRQLGHLIRRMDRYRARFTMNHFGRDINDPTLYHLVINLSLLSHDQTLDLLSSLIF